MMMMMRSDCIFFFITDFVLALVNNTGLNSLKHHKSHPSVLYFNSLIL